MNKKSLFIVMVLIMLIGVCSASASATNIMPNAQTLDTYTFTDDYGRVVALPATVDKIIPSGPLALSVLISFDADYLASSGKGIPASFAKYLPKIAEKNLPMTGGLLTSVSDVNYEEVMNLVDLGVDVYIDIGQAKAGADETLDRFTRISGLPAVFISQNSLNEIPDSYKKIGQVLCNEKRGEELYSYMKNWTDKFWSGMKTVEESGKKASAVQITKIDGNSINFLGGFNENKTLGYQGTPINTLTNNCVSAIKNSGLGDEYGMEAAMTILEKTDPKYIFINGADDHEYYRAFMNNTAFSNLKAVKTGNVYEIPTNAPYLWTASPFSGFGICGMIWMANILYPDVFSYNAKDKIQEFYKVVLGYNLTDEEYAKLTEKVQTSSKSTANSPAPILCIIPALFAACLFLRKRG